MLQTAALRHALELIPALCGCGRERQKDHVSNKFHSTLCLHTSMRFYIAPWRYRVVHTNVTLCPIWTFFFFDPHTKYFSAALKCLDFYYFIILIIFNMHFKVITSELITKRPIEKADSGNTNIVVSSKNETRRRARCRAWKCKVRLCRCHSMLYPL